MNRLCQAGRVNLKNGAARLMRVRPLPRLIVSILAGGGEMGVGVAAQ